MPFGIRAVFQSSPEMILSAIDFGGSVPPLWGKHFLQQNGSRAAKNTACYLPSANKICPEQGQITMRAKRAKRTVGYLPAFHAAKLQVKVTCCITVNEATPIQIEATRDHLMKKG